jgi:hypothetical protein
MKTTAKQRQRPTPAAAEQPATRYEFVFPGTGIRVPLPDGATEDEIDEAILSHPDVIAMGKQVRAEREEWRRRRAAAAQTNGKAPVDGAAAASPLPLWERGQG